MKRWLINKYYRWKYRIRRRLGLEGPVVWGSGEDMYFAMMERHAEVSPFLKMAIKIKAADPEEMAWYNEEKEE